VVSGLNVAEARSYITLDPERAGKLVEDEAMGLLERRERRRVKGVGNGRPRCGACASFKSSTSDECKQCGYREGVGR
jgi:hypothetical protein